MPRSGRKTHSSRRELSKTPPPAVLLPALLRERIPSEEFDYQTLVQALEDYSSPRDKITDLLEKGIIVRVKKGLYVFGARYRRRAIVREVIANLLFGPSYISLDYALQYHGLIPEAVESITSVTTGRSRAFHTPVGLYTYRRIPLRAFRVGMDLAGAEGGISFFVATPEKALADKLVGERGLEVRDVTALQAHLEEDLRVDTEDLAKLDSGRIARIAAAYGSRRVALLGQLVEVLQHETMEVR